MTATIETKPDTQEFMFEARHARELLVMLAPDLRKHHADGTSEVARGKWAQFQPSQGRNGAIVGRLLVNDSLARKVGYASADEMAAAMREHGEYGAAFFEIDVPRVAPSPEAAVGEVLRLTAARDVEGLTELYETERDNWNREPVIRACWDALKVLEAEVLPEPAKDETGLPEGWEPIKPDPALDVEESALERPANLGELAG